MKIKSYLFVYGIVGLLSLLMAGDMVRLQAEGKLHPDYKLLVGALQNDSTTVKNLLIEGADPNTPPGPNDKGMTALMFAAWKGHKEIVKVLIESGANVNDRSDSQATPLIYAAMSGNEEVVQMLLKKGADPNLQEQSGMTALLFAIKKNHSAVVKTLAENRSVNLSIHNRNGDTALLAASRTGRWEIVENLLKVNPALEEMDRFGQTPLMNAARFGHLSVALQLLDKGANANLQDRNGVSAIPKAIVGKHQTIALALRSRHRRR